MTPSARKNKASAIKDHQKYNSIDISNKLTFNKKGNEEHNNDKRTFIGKVWFAKLNRPLPKKL